jgi:hypothetical protein
MKLFYIFLVGISISLAAQEAKYKAALDSIAKYIRYTRLDREVQLITYYQPGLYNGMSETTDSITFYSMTNNEKTKIVFSDGNQIFMADLKKMDTTMIRLTRGISFYDASGKVKFRKSAIARIFNGKHGGVETDDFLLRMDYSEENRIIAQKLKQFLFEAILYSKKVKTKKSELKTVE